MRNFRRILAGGLLAVCACGMLAGCGGNEPESDTGSPTAPSKPDYTVSETVPTEQANADTFAVKNVAKKQNSPLDGKTVYWLGSSVTYGAASEGESMADYLAALTGCVCKKEAVSGTTLFDDGGSGDSGAKSYTRRLVNSTVFDKTEKIDAFVCQISTNDARNDRLAYWGKMKPDVFDKSQFDRKTTLGGAEFIIAYVIETWNCPVYFYSGGYFGDDGARKSSNPKGSQYGKLVDVVNKIADKWTYDGYNVSVIDLYNDEEFNNAVSDEYYAWCMQDAIHPRRAGYLQWWTPYFVNKLETDLAAKNR